MYISHAILIWDALILLRQEWDKAHMHMMVVHYEMVITGDGMAVPQAQFDAVEINQVSD